MCCGYILVAAAPCFFVKKIVIMLCMDKNTKEENKKRFMELSERSYTESRCIFTDFLGDADISDLMELKDRLYPCGIRTFGGFEGASHVMVGFGTEEVLGYEESFPIDCIIVNPRSKKFAENMEHKDYLGALMNLGIERSAVGDLVIFDDSCCFYCRNEVTDLILTELKKVRHTPVIAEKTDSLPREFLPKLQEESGTIQSLRMDSCIARIFKISREDAKRLIQGEKVIKNGRIEKNPSVEIKAGDIISARGYGKAIYTGEEGETKKGRLKINWKRFV